MIYVRYLDYVVYTIERAKYVVILRFGFFKIKKNENTQNKTKLDINSMLKINTN